MNILLVEHNVTMASALRRFLEQEGYPFVLMAHDGLEAARLLETSAVDLVLTAWELPQLCGTALVEWMRRHRRYRFTPVIMMTEKDRPDDVLAAVDAGVDLYLLKPVDRDLLTRKLARISELRLGRSLTAPFPPAPAVS